MQTFLPYASFEKSAKCLDNKRLGKQRVEAMQILTVLDHKRYYKDYKEYKKGWWNHPAVKMWQGYDEALRQYMRCVIVEWVNRGFANSISIPHKKECVLPAWLKSKAFLNSHRSNLIRKDKAWYGKYKWKVKNNLPYIWPTSSKERV